MSGSPFSATEVTAGTVSDDTTLTLQPYPCSMMNDATLVTTWADAQFISVIETSPHSSDCACAATGAAMAPAARIRDSFFMIDSFSVYHACIGLSRERAEPFQNAGFAPKKADYATYAR